MNVLLQKIKTYRVTSFLELKIEGFLRVSFKRFVVTKMCTHVFWVAMFVLFDKFDFRKII